ncbi:Uncharacterised protein [Mycobacterium tuberculosis]|nr:Uncharacterised protein [Mycobacterium tuberculosis]
MSRKIGINMLDDDPVMVDSIWNLQLVVDSLNRIRL